MRTRSLAYLALLTLLLVPSWASADCPQWRGTPFTGLNFANGANGAVLAMTNYNGDLAIGGAFSSVQGVSATEMATMDPSSGKWSALGSGLSGQVMCMTVWNGELVVGGTIATAGGNPVNYIAEWDGSAWHPLGSGMGGAVYVRALTVYNGQLIAGGAFITAGGVTVNDIAAWDGTSWHALGSGMGGGDYVTSLGVYGGKLVAGGNFLTAGGVSVKGVAQWDGTSWSAMGAGLIGVPGAFQSYNGDLYAPVETVVSGQSASYVAWWNGSSWAQSSTWVNYSLALITAQTGTLYVAGSSTTGGSYSVWTFDISAHTLTPLGYPGVGSTTEAITVYNNELVAGGSFTTADGRTANHIAVFDGTQWGSYGGGAATAIKAMTTYFGRTILGGDLHQSIPGKYEAHDIMGWDDENVYSYGTGMDGPVSALNSFTYSGIGVNRVVELDAGGNFLHAGGVAANYIARWQQNTFIVSNPAWEAMGPGFDATVHAIARFSNATYAGGDFIHSGATVVNYIAVWNESTQQWTSIGGMNGSVYALKVLGSYLYAGGNFTTAGGVSTGGLARWNGTTWSACGGFFNGVVYALEVYNNQLAIGGSYPGINSSPNLAQYDGTTYTTFGTGGTNATVHALHSTGPHLYVGGDFTSLGNQSINYVGYWDGASFHDTDGGVGNSVYALANNGHLVQVGGTFTSAPNYIGCPYWLRWDETGVPQFYSQPFSVTVNIGDNTSFTAVPDTGYTSLVTHWYRNGTQLANGTTPWGSTISGATSEVLDIQNVQQQDIGTYFCVLTEGSCGSDTSAVATLYPGTAGVGPTGYATVLRAIGPNPSPGTTHVQYSLARDSHVKVAVYDVAGRVVKSIDEGALSAGPHEAIWDATDSGGARVRAGVFFVGLEVDGRSYGTRRLTVVR